jgi:hypothetical protein
MLFTCSTIIIDDQREDSVVIDLELQPMPMIVVDILAGLNRLEAKRFSSKKVSLLIRRFIRDDLEQPEKTTLHSFSRSFVHQRILTMRHLIVIVFLFPLVEVSLVSVSSGSIDY